jgi:hypothetical protein
VWRHVFISQVVNLSIRESINQSLNQSIIQSHSSRREKLDLLLYAYIKQHTQDWLLAREGLVSSLTYRFLVVGLPRLFRRRWTLWLSTSSHP